MIRLAFHKDTSCGTVKNRLEWGGAGPRVQASQDTYSRSHLLRRPSNVPGIDSSDFHAGLIA